MQSMLTHRTEVIERFFPGNADPEHIDKWGNTSVINAAFADSHEVLELLLQLESMNTSTGLFDGKTLLHVLAANSDLKTIEILQNSRLRSIDAATLDAAGYTALDYFRQRKDLAYPMEPFGALLLGLDARSPNLGRRVSILKAYLPARIKPPDQLQWNYWRSWWVGVVATGLILELTELFKLEGRWNRY